MVATCVLHTNLFAPLLVNTLEPPKPGVKWWEAKVCGPHLLNFSAFTFSRIPHNQVSGIRFPFSVFRFFSSLSENVFIITDRLTPARWMGTCVLTRCLSGLFHSTLLRSTSE